MNQAFLPKKYASCFFLPGDARFHVKHCLFPPPEKSFLSNPDALPVRTGPRTAIRARSCFRPYNAEKKHCMFREMSRKMQCFYTS